jgi:energy-coupling factor transport system permease protein
LKYHYQDRLAYAITLGYLIAIVVIGRFVPFKLWIF